MSFWSFAAFPLAIDWAVAPGGPNRTPTASVWYAGNTTQGGRAIDPGEPVVDPGSPRAAAAYLIRLRPIVGDATGVRRALAHSLRELADDVRRGGPMVAERAGAIGNERIGVFHALRDQLDQVTPPPSCEAAHMTLGRWLNRLIDCCDVLRTVGTTGDVAQLGRAQSLLAEAREYARGFNDEHAALVGEIRDLVDDATLRARLPFR